MNTTKWILRLLDHLPAGKLITDLVFFEDYGALHRIFLDFRLTSPVGVGGLDSEGRYFDIFSHSGAAFDIIGPVTADNAIGTIRRINGWEKDCIPFISISKRRKSIEDEEIIKDFSDCFSLIYDFAPLFILDLSDPILDQGLIRDIISSILDIRFTYEESKPVIIRTGKHITLEELDSLVNFCRLNNVDGIMCWGEKQVSHIYTSTDGRFPIIGYGEIGKAASANNMLKSGANLICLEGEIASKGLWYITRLKRQLSSLLHNGK